MDNQIDPRLKYLFDKGYTPDTIRQKAQQGIDPENLYYFEKGYTPKDIQIEKNKATEGFGKKLLRSIAEPVATLATRPFQLAKAIGGATPEQQGVSLPFLGRIETSQSGTDVLKDIGRGAETISLGIGGGGAKTVLQTGLKGLVKEGAKEGLEVGLKSGALTGFGQGLEIAAEQKPEDAFKTIFASTAIGTGLGGISGGVLGSATPLVVKGVSGLKGLTKLDVLESKLSDSYRKIFNPTARQLKADKRFGNDSFGFLSKELPDMPLDVDKNGRIIADDALEMARQKYTAEATAYKPIIRNSGKYVDIDDVIAKAKAQAKQEFDGTDLLKAEQQIDNEVNAYLANNPADVNVTANGKRFVTLDRADDIKSYSWSRGKGWGTPEAEVWNDTNNLIGHALKDAIEKELPNAPIKAMNRRLGQWKNAIDMLEKRNGQVSGSGGKLSKYIIKATGTSIGAGFGDGDATGRLTGAGAGFMTATALATILANPNVRLYVVRQLIKNLQKAGRSDMIREAQEILQSESSKYLLPAAGQSSYVQPSQKAINLPQSIRETNIGLDEVRRAKINMSNKPQALLNAPGQNPIRLNQSMPKNSQIAQPIKAPTTTAKNVPISKSISQPKVESTLLSEAKKYKTPEEYIKAQGTPVYHGTNGNFTEFKLPEGKRTDAYGKGVYMTNGKEKAAGYGKNILEVYLPKNIKILDIYKPEKLNTSDISNIVKQLNSSGYKSSFEDGWIKTELGNIDTLELSAGDIVMRLNQRLRKVGDSSTMGDLVKSIGYDGIKTEGASPNNYTQIIYNPDIVNTKSKLIDIWNKSKN